MKFQHNDGGRAAAGIKGKGRDCIIRAVAIASELPYLTVLESLNVGCQSERKSKTMRECKSARNGVYTKRTWFKRYMESLGFTWTATMTIGSGCTVHLRNGQLPAGRLVVIVSKHLVAVLDGVLHDLSDCSRGGDRCVYGYWRKS
jgi:hypothetical protein